MSVPFDTNAEEQKLAMLRQREEEDLAEILSEKYGLAYKDLSVVPVNMDALRLLPEEEARGAEAAVFDKNGKHVSLALRNPQNELLPSVRESLTKRGFILDEVLVSGKSLEHILSRYVDLSYASTGEAGVFSVGKEGIEALSQKISTLASFKEHVDELMAASHTTSHLVEEILVAALALRASDVHIEPEENDVRLRLRLDGLLTNAYSFDAHAYRAILSRIKLLSGLKLNVTDRAQDGRFTIAAGDMEIEIRASVIPGGYGETVVLRILNPESIAVSFDELGIHPKLLDRLKKEIKRPNGMLLTTGPTGSGKTTSLYAFLRFIHTPDIKIITIEDPIEYHLPGIVQTQTDQQEYTFESGLRSILRQDPDVIMVGEIRDREVADTAMQAALTGHFVFSTLHTNNAAGTFPRLVDLGIDPKTFSSAITVAMAQRLVRRLDPNKRKQVPLEGDQRAMVEEILSTVADKALLPSSLDTIYVADRGDSDDPTVGYSGRVGLYEAIFMDEALGSFLRDNPSEGEIAERARAQGYLTMAQDGVLKALAGVTSLDEVFKVVDLPPCTHCADQLDEPVKAEAAA